MKLKMSHDARFAFSISVLPPEVTFQMSGHFLHLWTLFQKNAPQIFDRRTGYKNIGQNVKDSCFWASCIAGILNYISICFSQKHKQESALIR